MRRGACGQVLGWLLLGCLLLASALSSVGAGALGAGTGPLVYSVRLGGRCSPERAYGVAVDPQGDIYVTGTTCSKDFPTTPGALDRSFPDAVQFRSFVAKLNATRGLEYSTFIGGTSFEEHASAITVDAEGSAFVAGYTADGNLTTTPGAYQRAFGGALDAFVLKLNADGSALEFATYLGGQGYDEAISIDLDRAGNLYIGGWTSDRLGGLTSIGTNDFPATRGAFDEEYSGTGDGFLTKMSADGSTLVYSTFLGGAAEDVVHSVRVDAQGHAYVTGETESADFPTTPNAFAPAKANGLPDGGPFNARDSFVAKLSPDGADLTYGTYFGGNGWDAALSLAIDESGHAYLTGLTTSSDLPVSLGAFQRSNESFQNAFVAELSRDGGDVLYSTYLGGGLDIATGVALRPSGDIAVGGFTRADTFPTTSGALDVRLEGSEDGFLSVISASTGGLAYSTLLGGQSFDEVFSLTTDPSGRIVTVGVSGSVDFPTTSLLYPGAPEGRGELFVTIFDPIPLTPPAAGDSIVWWITIPVVVVLVATFLWAWASGRKRAD